MIKVIKGGTTEERGSIIILASVLVFVFMILAAMVIDLTLAASSNEQHQHVAELAAISALDMFLQTFNPDDPEKSIESHVAEIALQRAQSVIGNTSTISFSGSELLEGLNTQEETNSGKIVFGRWWSECDPGTGCQPVCDDVDGDGELNTPPNCFQSVTNLSTTSASSSVVQAIKVELNYPQPIGARFAKLLGFSGFGSQVSAVASKIPMHGVFLVDMSRSMVLETHLDPGLNNPSTPDTVPEPGTAHYAFQMDINTASAPFDATVCDPGDVNPCLEDDDYDQNCIVNDTTAGWERTAYRGNYGSKPGMPVYRPNYNNPEGYPGDPGPKTVHYRSDYKCYNVTYRRDDGELDGNPSGAPAVTQTYLIDSYQNLLAPVTSSDYYAGPEPLVTVLDGIYFATRTFQQRNVSGDMMGAMFFESTQYNNIFERIFPLAPAKDNVPSFRKLQDAVNITDPANLHDPTLTYPKNIVEYFTFPRVENNTGAPGAYTDLYDALSKALNMLENAPNAAGAYNFVTVISDGLSNCTRTECIDDYMHWLQSINDEVRAELIAGFYAPQRIPINFVCAGQDVGCNTLNINKTGSDCSNPFNVLNDGERRRRDFPYVYVDPSELEYYPGGDPYTQYEQRSVTNPFYLAAHYMHLMANETNGFYFTLRPVDVVAPGATGCTPEDTSGCADDAWNGVPRSCIDDSTAPTSSTQPYQTWINPGVVQRYDPYGRSTQAQMRDFVTQIFRQNAIVLRDDSSSGRHAEDDDEEPPTTVPPTSIPPTTVITTTAPPTTTISPTVSSTVSTITTTIRPPLEDDAPGPGPGDGGPV